MSNYEKNTTIYKVEKIEIIKKHSILFVPILLSIYSWVIYEETISILSTIFFIYTFLYYLQSTIVFSEEYILYGFIPKRAVSIVNLHRIVVNENEIIIESMEKNIYGIKYKKTTKFQNYIQFEDLKIEILKLAKKSNIQIIRNG
jgi:hypothetical protein